MHLILVIRSRGFYSLIAVQAAVSANRRHRDTRRRPEPARRKTSLRRTKSPPSSAVLYNPKKCRLQFVGFGAYLTER